MGQYDPSGNLWRFLVIQFTGRPFVYLLMEILKIFELISNFFVYEHTWRRLIHKYVVLTTLYIFAFIFTIILYTWYRGYGFHHLTSVIYHITVIISTGVIRPGRSLCVTFTIVLTTCTVWNHDNILSIWLKSHLSLLPFTDMSRYEISEEIPLWVICKWPYVTVQWKWHLGNYESIIIWN